MKPAKTTTKTIIGHRYLVHETLGKGGMGLVYRVSDLLTDDVVALKQVALSDQDKSPLDALSSASEAAFRVALTREFRTLASLRHPNIISVLDYGFDEAGMPYLTMEFLPKSKTIIEAGRDQPFEVQVHLLIQMLQALAYLHRRGIIHRDVKPDNIMVIEDESGAKQVRVLDFGLALARQRLEDSKGDSMSGTFLYMAPEVLHEQPASEASDLYAVGMIAFEMFSGRYPYDSTQVTQLIRDILTKQPDLTWLDLPDVVSDAIRELLHKTPAERPQSAQAVLNRFGEALGIAELVRESEAIRESYLQAAEFVGRKDEIAQFSGALGDLVDQHGSAWLIGGESGIGKTRLLDEVRTLAMVKGVLVLRGQVSREGSVLYELWREPLRRLALTTPLSDLEAGVLKVLIPDIARLLGRNAPDAPEVEPRAAKERLLATVEEVFRRQSQPVLLILEDLHWASESLDILERLNAHVEQLPLLIVGSYRDDEKPDLPAQLASMHLMKLDRLDREAMRELSASMLGEAGQQREVIDLIERETEGNAFFMVEVVRALAEEAGHLHLVGKEVLPERIFAGSIQQIMQRRLDRIVPEHRALYHVTAAAGRQIDRAVLSKLFAEMMPEVGLDSWLQAGLEAAVIELHDEQWQFAHDKLREALLGDLAPDEVRWLHRQVAQAIEAVYSNQPDKAPLLAYRWREAGEDEKSTHYAALAATQAMRAGLNKQAKYYFVQALDALLCLPETPDQQRQLVDLAVGLSKVSAYLPSENVSQMLERGLAAAEALGDEAVRARMYGGLGGYTFMAGRYGEAFDYFQRCIALAEKLGLEELLLVPYNVIGRALASTGEWQKAADMLAKGIPLAWKFNDQELLSGSETMYGAALAVQGNLTEGQLHMDRGLKISEEMGHKSRIAGNLMTMTMCYLWCGHYDEVMETGTRCLQLAEETQDLHPLYIVNGALGLVHFMHGDLKTAALHLDRSLQLAEAGNVLLFVPIFQAYRVEIDVLQGQVDQAVERVEAALALAERARQSLSKGEVERILGRIWMHIPKRDLEKAESYFKQSIETHQQTNTPSLIAVSQLELGKLYRQQKRGAECLAVIDEAKAAFQRLGMDWHLAQVRKL